MKNIATALLVAGLMASPMLALPPTARAAVNIDIGISVGVPPPPLPVYMQPVAPGPGYIWTPGYWAWEPSYGDYYWVPGTWVMPPQVGLLWTPGWWGRSEGRYRWHPGYWGTHVGFYGGVNYGFGYFGSGYVGGRWRGNRFYYNRAVNNVNVATVRNVYVDRTFINNGHVNRVSYNGGHGGLTARPTAAQRSYANQHRVSPTRAQLQQRDRASRDPAQRFKSRQGHPAVFATRRPEGVTRSSAHDSMVAAPQRAHQSAPAPQRGDNPRVPNAPAHNRPTAPAPIRTGGAVEAPNRHRGTVQMPRGYAQPMTHERAQPVGQRANQPHPGGRMQSAQGHRPPASTSHGTDAHRDGKKAGKGRHR